MNENRNKIINWLLAVAGTCFMLFYLDGTLPREIFWKILFSRTFHILILLFVAIYFIIRQFDDGIEIRLLLFYCLWAGITRIIQGDTLLKENWRYLADLSLMIVVFAPGVLLKRASREKLLTWMAVFVLVFLFTPGIIAIFTAITRSYVYSDLWKMGIGYPDEWWRITIFSVHPNTSAGIYLAALCLALILFFHTHNLWLRIMLVLSSCVSFIVIALTASRNGQTWAAVVIGLTVGFVVFERLGISLKKGIRFLVLIMIAGILAASLYQLNEPIRSGLWNIYEKQNATTISKVSDNYNEEEQLKQKDVEVPASTETESSTAVQTEEESESEDIQYHPDTRNYFESQRKTLYWSALKSLQIEPKRILIGSPKNDVMDVSYSLIPENHWDSNFHNVFLDVINHFGAPALMLVILFYCVIIRHGFGLLLADPGKRTFKDLPLLLPVVAFMGYHMLESTFIGSDFCGLFLFFSCGMLTGTAKEIKTSQD